MLTDLAAPPHSDRPTPAIPITSTLLIVRHGVRRGPSIRMRGFRPPRCQPMFDDIAHRWPEIGRRMRYWETGNAPPNLDDVGAVLFLLQDPLRESHPQCYAESVALADQAKQRGARIINDPRSLSNTIKSTQSRIWLDAGLPTPPCVSFKTVEELYAAAAEFSSRMIIKSDTQHAQTKTIVVEDLAEIQRMPIDELPLPGSLSPFIDTREGFEELDPNSPYATHFHKKRAMVFGDHVHNNHVFFSERPIVGCVSSTFGHFRSLNPIRRAIGNAKCRRHIEYDLRYHESENEDPALFVKAASALGVEFCAIDYSTDVEGRIVLWEANPYFSLHRWPIGVLGRLRKLDERTPHLHEAAGRFFRDLLGVGA